MANLGKTAVSLLEELASTMKMRTHYTDASCSQYNGRNRFQISVLLGEHYAEGEGSNKKEAKHNAARNMLDLLNMQAPSKQLNEDNDANYNAVGALMEISVKKGSPVPIFNEYISAYGEGGKFMCECKFLDKTVSASSYSKKSAKKLAAHKMIEILSMDMETDQNDGGNVDGVIYDVQKPNKQELLSYFSVNNLKPNDKVVREMKKLSYQKPVTKLNNICYSFISMCNKSETLQTLVSSCSLKTGGLEKSGSCYVVLSIICSELGLQLMTENIGMKMDIDDGVHTVPMVSLTVNTEIPLVCMNSDQETTAFDMLELMVNMMA